MILIHQLPFHRTVAIVVISFALGCSSCVTQSGRLPDERTQPIASGASPGLTLDLPRLALRVKDKYLNEDYIAFTSFVEVHQPLAPGWIVHPEKRIAPGAAFDVVMSAKGDSNVKLHYGSRLVYEWQVAVREQNELVSSGANEYVLREYDHARGLRTDEQVFQKEPPETFLLSDQALETAEWCASGGYVVIFVGPEGKVADRDYDQSYVEKIESGTLLGRRDGADGAPIDAIRWVQSEATGLRRRPDGQELDASPAIWWDTFVDRERALIVGEEGYIGFPGREPILVRRKRYENIRFPRHVDHRIFTDVPESARDYRLWKPGEPYPREQAENTQDNAPGIAVDH